MLVLRSRSPPLGGGQSQDVKCAGLPCASFLLADTPSLPLLGRRKQWCARQCWQRISSSRATAPLAFAPLGRAGQAARGHRGAARHERLFQRLRHAGPIVGEAGITTLAYDQRGFGRGDQSRHLGGRRCDARRPGGCRARRPVRAIRACRCLRWAKAWAGRDADGARLGRARPPLNVDGVILVAPAVWSRGDMPLSYRAALFLGAHLVPGMILSNSAASHVVTIVPPTMCRCCGRCPAILCSRNKPASARFTAWST